MKKKREAIRARCTRGRGCGKDDLGYILIVRGDIGEHKDGKSARIKKHGTIPRNFVVLYHGSYRGIILRKSWYYTSNSWYYPSGLLVGLYHEMHDIIPCSSYILPLLNYKNSFGDGNTFAQECVKLVRYV